MNTQTFRVGNFFRSATWWQKQDIQYVSRARTVTGMLYLLYFDWTHRQAEGEIKGDLQEKKQFIVKRNLIPEAGVGTGCSLGGGILAYHVQCPEFSPQLHINRGIQSMLMISVLRWQRQKAQEFKVIIDYIVSSRPSWALLQRAK